VEWWIHFTAIYFAVLIRIEIPHIRLEHTSYSGRSRDAIPGASKAPVPPSFMVCRCSARSSPAGMAAVLRHVDRACAPTSWPGWRNRQAVRDKQGSYPGLPLI
jgi:hypothetical protein